MLAYIARSLSAPSAPCGSDQIALGRVYEPPEMAFFAARLLHALSLAAQRRGRTSARPGRGVTALFTYLWSFGVLKNGTSACSGGSGGGSSGAAGGAPAAFGQHAYEAQRAVLEAPPPPHLRVAAVNAVPLVCGVERAAAAVELAELARMAEHPLSHGARIRGRTQCTVHAVHLPSVHLADSVQRVWHRRRRSASTRPGERE